MDRPSLLLVHGAANGAWVWDAWRRHLRNLGWDANVLDLRGHGRSLPVDFANLMIEDYLADLESVASQIAASKGLHPVIGGWDMGGLVAMIYAAAHAETPALVTFSPWQPVEVAGRLPLEEIRKTPSAALGPEYFGVYPDDAEASNATLSDLTEEEAARVLANSAGALESGFARRQTQRGISIAPGAVRCPSLLIYGEKETERPPELNRRLALYLGGESLAVPESSHWGLVASERHVEATAPQLDAWLQRVLN